VDSRAVRPGDLFVAVRGGQRDGRSFVDDARARGALAACAESPVAGLPTLVVADPRRALAPLSAALCGHPAAQLALVGITGTLGKTSTALLVEAALGPVPPVGVVGSLGVRVGGRRVDGAEGTAAMTTPDAPALHRAFRAIVDAGARTAVMEVTSHALAQGRVDGLRFALGVFTNLVPDEHLEFHATADDYVRTKLRFLDQLAPDAPLVIDHDDAGVAGATRALGDRVVGVSLRGDPGAAVVVEYSRADASGTVLALRLTRPLPRLDGRTVGPLALPLVVPVFGEPHAANAALAAAAALLAGATPDAVTGAVAALRPIPRRMEVLRPAAPFVLDDTSGNPRTVAAVFRSLRHVPHATLRVLFGARGGRGTTINRGLAGALAAGALAAAGPVRLVVTTSEGTAAPRDRVTDEERAVVLDTLAGAGVAFDYEPTLAAAAARVCDGWGPDDALLVLGAQAMDDAGALVLARLDGAPAREG
jgi:UDP-N-acetylmuramoyl-L-alanyl-D-glutamate--2,6-diaminopimelate ligase